MPNAGFYAQRIGGAPKRVNWRHEGWRYGQNSFAEDNEIRNSEFYSGRNIELIGRSSVRLGRRGHREFADIVGGTSFNGWGVYKDPKTGANELIVQHTGRVYSISTGGVVTEIDNTKTWDTTAKMRGVLLRESFYFGNAVDYMAKTDGDTITRWNAVTAPTGLTMAVTNVEANDTIYEYAVTAVTENGETEISSIVDDYAPRTLDASNYIDLEWTRSTDADVVGYNIYKAVNGRTLLLLTFIDQQTSGATMTYQDDGVETQSLIYESPSFNTTGGVKGNIFGKYANTLFVSGNLQEPDTVFYGGTGSKFESFAPSDNGGWIKPGRGDGEKVTAMIGFEDFLFMFKETSIWKFVFGSDGNPTLVAVIPQYGTSSPDSVWRMEKDVIFHGSDGRYRILGYEPTQLNVIRTADISNRIQPDLDSLDQTSPENFFAAFFEQKYIVCNGTVAYPYDRRYTGFLGEWTNFNFDRFIIWDRGTGQDKLYAARSGSSEIDQLLVNNTFDDNGDTIDASIRFKRIDGDSDFVKYFMETRFKLKLPRGQIRFITYEDGASVVDDTSLSFSSGGGIGEFMFDEGMFDEGIEISSVPDAVQYVTLELEFEAKSYYHQLSIAANEYNHALIQTMSGSYELEDGDYRDEDELVIRRT